MISIVDFPQFKADTFNRCANEDFAIAMLPIWNDVHPLLKTLPTDWGLSVSYGILHSPKPAEHVREFLDAVKKARCLKTCSPSSIRQPPLDPSIEHAR